MSTEPPVRILPRDPATNGGDTRDAYELMLDVVFRVDGMEKKVDKLTTLVKLRLHPAISWTALLFGGITAGALFVLALLQTLQWLAR